MLDVKRNLTTMTDFYELTMSAGYLDEGYVDKIAVFDMFFRRVPDGGGYAIMAGLQQFIDAVDHLKFTQEDIDYLAGKASRLRVFDDEAGVMNLDVRQTAGELLVVSQFTLHASTRKGNRPSYFRAAGEAFARPMYERFVAALAAASGRPVRTGEFGADMAVELVNDGPVTIWIDSKNKE